MMAVGFGDLRFHDGGFDEVEVLKHGGITPTAIYRTHVHMIMRTLVAVNT